MRQKLDDYNKNNVRKKKGGRQNKSAKGGTIFLCAFVYVLYRYMVIICTSGKVFLPES